MAVSIGLFDGDTGVTAKRSLSREVSVGEPVGPANGRLDALALRLLQGEHRSH